MEDSCNSLPKYFKTVFFYLDMTIVNKMTMLKLWMTGGLDLYIVLDPVGQT